MRRATAAALAALAAVLAAAPEALSAHSSAAPRSRPSAAPAHLLVYAQEWSLWPSRTSLPAGAVTVTLWNRGQDPHDLRIRPLPGGRLTASASRAIAPVASGELAAAAWRLTPGRYVLYCALPEHEHLGMHTLITVR